MMKVAVIQMVSGADISSNLKVAERLIREAVDKGARLVLLPENFALFDSQQLYSFAKQEAEQGSMHIWLSHLAKRLNIWLFAGSLPIVSGIEGCRKVRSALLVYSPAGELVARYDKRHLFDVQVSDGQGSYHESAFIEPGNNLVVVETDIGRVGLSICYDLRFPDHFWQLREQGADIIVVPSAFTKVTGDAHWEVLLRARAIETQCFILGANQGGMHSPTRVTSGNSMIIDPWGEVLSRCEQGEAVATAGLDRERLNTVRSGMPVLSQRR
jgi:predicted amidohydrolase